MIDFLSDERFLDHEDKAIHGFFGRRGGVSAGLYGSLNCGTGSNDNPAHVRQNRAAVAAAMGVRADHLVTLHQVHSAECTLVDRPFADSDRPKADAMVTDTPGLALGILTADCGPVLFYGVKADRSPVIGAAHAGWGGALKGVLEATVKAMTERGAKPESIRAGIGPCIGPRSYEVTDEFAAPFLALNPESEHFFKTARREGHLMFDLPGYIAFRLAGCGVRSVTITGFDTCAMENDYFSYRRTTHRAEPDYGRQISVIASP